MPEVIIDARDLDRVGDRLIADSRRGEALVTERMRALGEALKDGAVEAIKAVTPVGETGDLQTSTDGHLESAGEATRIVIEQPLEVSSHVNTWVLSDLLIKGHDVVTKDRRVVGHVAAHDYPKDAENSIEAMMNGLIEESVARLTEELAQL